MKKVVSALTALVMACTMFSGTLSADAEGTQTNQQPTVENNISISGTNSLGNIIADDLSAAYDEQLNGNGCNIQSVEMSGNTAEVKFSTVYDATLIVGIYDDSGEQMLGSNKIDVDATDIGATIPINIGEMPQYYTVKAFLVDRLELSPLCTVYENKNYTKNMQ